MSLFAIVSASFSLAGCQQATTSTSLSPQEMGQKVYRENCASCHGVSGAGASMLLEGKNIHFNEANWQSKYTDEQLLTIIKTGRGSMPSFDGLFTPEEEKNLIAYIRVLGQPQ